MEEDWIPEAREAPHLPIINQIEREDWNGAKKAVQKKLQKSTDTIYPALLTFIQAHQGLANERSEALLRILKLAEEKDEAKERITNIDDLEIYEHAAKQLAKGGDAYELSEAIGKIRSLAVKKIPTDENFATACLKKCMTESNFEAALSIALSMGKYFPKNRKYLFYQPLIRLLLSQAPHVDERQKSIYLQLATLTLQKYAKGATDAKGETLPVQSLQDRQEIMLFHRALEMSGQHEELIATLLNPKIGVNSDIVKGDWSVVKSLVDALHVSDAPDAAKKTIDLCVNLLEKACANEEGKIVEPMYGDWAVWNAYIDAIMLATEDGTRAAFLMEKFFEINNKHRFSDPPISKTNQRNARLASVKFMVRLNPLRKQDTWTFKAYEHDQLSSILHEIKLKEGGNPKELKKLTSYIVRNVPRRLLTIIEYLHEYGHVTAAFTDIEPYFQLLGNDEREHLLGIAAFVMVDRRGWSCVEWGQDIECPQSVNFPPKVNVPDQITAVINHYKFSYLSSDMLDPFQYDSDEEEPQKKEMLNADYAICTKCKLLAVDKDESVKKVWGKRRGMCCEHCLRAVILYGMATYDHAINGWAEKAWSPFATKKTDMHPGDDAVIMVAMALIKLGGRREQIQEKFPIKNGQADTSFRKRHSDKRLIQAAAILEFAHSKSPANPQLLLLLVRLYLVLGAGSLAMRAYSKLNLKQVQGETLGYVLLDRISMMHPYPCHDIMTGDEPVPFDPAIELAKIHQRYRAFKTQISRNYMTCLQTGSYGSIFQLIDVQEKLSPSLACVMSVMELRKLIRIRDPDTLFTKSSHGYDILPNGVMNNIVHDNIDYESFPSFEHSPGGSHHAFIHEFLETGPMPSDGRTRGDILVDELMMLIKAPFDSRANMSQLLHDLKHHEDAFDRTILREGSKSSLVTEYEQHYLFTAINLVCVVTSVGYHGKKSSGLDGQLRDQDLARLRNTLEWMRARVQDVRETFNVIPAANSTLQPLYIIHQTVQMVIGVDKLLQQPSFQKNQKTVERFQSFVNEPVRELLKELKNAAAHIKTTMDKGGHIDMIISQIEEFPNPQDEYFSEEVIGDNYTKATLGKGLRRVLTPEFTELFASELVASWNESILGLQCLL